MIVVFLFFFFSSRRRHTRLQGDWSSDVCSSDLRSGRRRHGRRHVRGRAASRRDGHLLAARFLRVVLLLLDVVEDRKSTRLNSSHLVISYAVFCLKKKTHLLLAECAIDANAPLVN